MSDARNADRGILLGADAVPLVDALIEAEHEIQVRDCTNAVGSADAA